MLPDEVLLCMASHLSWCSSHHKVARYISPIPFSIFLKTLQKQPEMKNYPLFSDVEQVNRDMNNENIPYG